MKRRIILIACLFFSIIASGQNYEPMELAKQIFGKTIDFDIDYYVTGEYKGQSNGSDLSDEIRTEFLLLDQTDNNATVNMTLIDSVGNGVDTYLFFEKDSIWRMSAFRGLAMTGILKTILSELENMTTQQIDSMMNSVDEDGGFRNEISSKEDYDHLLGNLRLTLDRDNNIIEHFLNYQTEFDRIKDLIFKEIDLVGSDEINDLKSKDVLKNDYRKLFISSISYDNDYGFNRCLNFLIGGISDNTVGYIYVRDKKDVPEMNPGMIIMIREIGNGWYMYKTT